MDYIIKQDIVRNLSDSTLRELTGGNDAIGNLPATAGNDLDWEIQVPIAIELISGYTRHWYDMVTEFRAIQEYNTTVAYAVGDRVAGVEVDGVRPLYNVIQAAPANTPITNTSYFEPRDTRNPLIVRFASLIVIYNISTKDNPRLVSEQRQLDYENVISSLRDIQRGKLDISLPKRSNVESDDSGHSYAWGDFEGITHSDY